MKTVTTFEQGQELRRLGVNLSTADWTWKEFYDEEHIVTDHRLEHIPFNLSKRGREHRNDVPGWSTDALLNLCSNEYHVQLCSDENGWHCNVGANSISTYTRETPNQAVYDAVKLLIANGIELNGK